VTAKLVAFTGQEKESEVRRYQQSLKIGGTEI
jgi:hypothetical protein